MTDNGTVKQQPNVRGSPSGSRVWMIPTVVIAVAFQLVHPGTARAQSSGDHAGPVLTDDGDIYPSRAAAVEAGRTILAEGECVYQCTGLERAPVCADDFTTFSSACFAACANANIVHNRPCDCICTDEYDPVCGVDENTYTNPCEAWCAEVEVDYGSACATLYTDYPDAGTNFMMGFEASAIVLLGAWADNEAPALGAALHFEQAVRWMHLGARLGVQRHITNSLSGTETATLSLPLLATIRTELPWPADYHGFWGSTMYVELSGGALHTRQRISNGSAVDEDDSNNSNNSIDSDTQGDANSELLTNWTGAIGVGLGLYFREFLDWELQLNFVSNDVSNFGDRFAFGVSGGIRLVPLFD